MITTIILGVLGTLGLVIADCIDMAKEERAREEYKKEKMERLAWEDMMEKKRARYAETGIWE